MVDIKVVIIVNLLLAVSNILFYIDNRRRWWNLLVAGVLLGITMAQISHL